MLFKNEIILTNTSSIKKEKIYEIMYFISMQGITEVFIINEKSYIVDSTLNKLETELPIEFFFRINRQIIVNFLFIKCINYKMKREIIMDDNKEFIISKRRINKFIDLYSKIIRRSFN